MQARFWPAISEKNRACTVREVALFHSFRVDIKKGMETRPFSAFKLSKGKRKIARGKETEEEWKRKPR